MLQRVAAEQELDGRTEHLAELEVDPPHRPVKVDLVVEVQARVEEHVKRLGPVRVQGQAALRDERVVDDPLHVHRAGRHTTYIGIARDVVHVVGRKRADQRGTQHDQPGRRLEAS